VDFDGLTGFFLERIESGLIGAALIDGDLVRETLLPNGFSEKAQSSPFVATGSKQEIDGLAIPIDSTIATTYQFKVNNAFR
jgi:hypothetical protein